MLNMSSPREPLSGVRGSLPGVSGHHAAVLQALLVTFLWSTSYVFIKVGLRDIPALTFAGLRYGLAAVCLVGLLAVRPGEGPGSPRSRGGTGSRSARSVSVSTP